MTIQHAQEKAFLSLRSIYEEREAHAITDWLMEHLTGKKRIDRLIIKPTELTEEQEDLFLHHLTQLEIHKPIQYVLGEAWFKGLKFFVNQNVLIPRPETEELVEWVREAIQNSKFKIQNIIDIGTGSGCIPISLKKIFPEISVFALEVSEGALEVAKRNASNLQAGIDLIHLDFLNEENWSSLQKFDIIVSNPPYIKSSERESMHRNVLDFEPSIALFVEEDDALIFYRKIADFAITHLNQKGMVFLEINEALGKEVVSLFEGKGYETCLRKDLQGKDRMLKVNLKMY
jgi:release factor glutamine methyltransferase